MDEGEPGVPGAGELVVNDHLDPLSVLPELETEEAAVTSLLAEALASDQHLVQGPKLRGQAGKGGQQPAVPQLALDDIKLGFSSQVCHNYSQVTPDPPRPLPASGPRRSGEAGATAPCDPPQSLSQQGTWDQQRALHCVCIHPIKKDNFPSSNFANLYLFKVLSKQSPVHNFWLIIK